VTAVITHTNYYTIHSIRNKEQQVWVKVQNISGPWARKRARMSLSVITHTNCSEIRLVLMLFGNCHVLFDFEVIILCLVPVRIV
jgi:hypothetical protein